MEKTDAQKLKEIAERFETEGKVISAEPLGAGFINDTFVVKTEGDAPNYILQRKNKTIFPDVPAMMKNIVAVTNHIREKVENSGGNADKEVLRVIMTSDGLPWYQSSDGEFWAMCEFIENAVTYDRADTPALAYKGGQGIGRFQSQLADFEGELTETIKGFHNIRYRFEQWDESLKRDAAGRVKDLEKEISWIESRREEMLNFWEKVEQGIIPRRVTHNDTKISNILFNESGEVMCVIDLDTVMSSTSLNDFGDAIRSYANTAAEDEPDTDRVALDLDMFKAYTEGYLSERRLTLTDSEIDHLAFAARYLTFEQALRFLMDYIDGDTYYKIGYPEHNLVRTRAQNKLLESMEEHYEEMVEIVNKLARQ